MFLVAHYLLFIFHLYPYNFCKRGRRLRTSDDKLYYKNISHAFLAVFIGFIDGDGYIKLTRTTTGYIAMELVISVDVRDKSTLDYFYSTIKLGRIYTHKTTVKYIIGKVDLQEVLFPLIQQHGIFFLTHTRRIQHSTALDILYSNILKFDNIPFINENLLLNIPNLPTNFIDYGSIPFFRHWLPFGRFCNS